MADERKGKTVDQMIDAINEREELSTPEKLDMLLALTDVDKLKNEVILAATMAATGLTRARATDIFVYAVLRIARPGLLPVPVAPRDEG